MADPATDYWLHVWQMGGYARYVWSAYGIAAVIMVANVVTPVLAHRRMVRRIRNGEFVDD